MKKKINKYCKKISRPQHSNEKSESFCLIFLWSLYLCYESSLIASEKPFTNGGIMYVYVAGSECDDNKRDEKRNRETASDVGNGTNGLLIYIQPVLTI